MTHPLVPPEWGGTSPTTPGAGADGVETTDVALPKDGPTRNSLAFALYMIGFYAFVLALIVLAKIRPDHALEIAAGATGIGVAGFYSRNAAVTFGRRMINGPGPTRG